MPFSDTRLLNVLSHTFWFLPNVASCYAMYNLLQQKQNSFYHDYHINVCAGTKAGIGVDALEPVQKSMGDPLSTKTITLKNAQGNTSVIKSADLDVLGGSFRPITESQKNQLSIKYGVEVMKVNSGALKDGGISRGFIIQRINDNNINTIDDLQKAVKSASTSKDPVLYIQGIWPTGKKAYFAVPLQKD